MKKLIQIIVAAVISTAFIGSFASAASCNGEITVTGPDSTNTITCDETTDITISCVDNKFVGNINDQDATSGDATGEGNTTSGTVTSGTATNDNGSTVVLGSACGTAQSTTTTETPGKGSTELPATPVIAALPNTATTPTIVTTVGSVIAAAAIVAAARFAYVTVRRFTTK